MRCRQTTSNLEPRNLLCISIFTMSDDADSSNTYTQQAGTIHKNGYLVIKGRPCKVVEVSRTGKHGHVKCHFVAIDIFTGDKFEHIVPASHDCDVPRVTRRDYHLMDISEDGLVSLSDADGTIKDDLKLPTEENLRSHMKDAFDDGKEVVVSVISAMGEEQISAVKTVVTGASIDRG